MKTINIYPSRLKQFGETRNCSFCLVTNSDLISHFNITSDSYYQNSFIVAYDQENNFSEILTEQIPENTHILVITPNCYFYSPKAEVLGKRKLVIMANNSTPTSLDAIEHFLRCGERTNPDYLDNVSDKFFELADDTEKFLFTDDEYNTIAEFKHTNENLKWHQQAGRLEWGQQQLFPSGEISTLPVDVYDMDIQTSFELNGEITLRSHPILHTGKTSYLPADQEKIFQTLAELEHNPVIATVENGIIKKLRTTSSKKCFAKEMLNALFELDSRYQTIIEIGFGINHWVKLFAGNSAMNEVHAANVGGTIHFGLGLTPFTQYHLDLLCPNIKILNTKNEIIFGKDNINFNSLIP